MSDEHNDIHAVLDELGAPRGSTTAMRIRALAAGFERSKASLMDALAFARKERDDALTALGQMTARATEEEQRATRATAEINAVRDALNDANIPYADTPAKRIREITLHAASTLAAARAGFDSAMAAVVKERDDNEAAWRGAREHATQQQRRTEAAEHSLATQTRLRSEAECLRDAALREARSLTHERDNCREVLRKEREERAAEKATLGAALQALRAETDTLGDTVDRLHEENERLAAQLEFAERVLIAGIRRATP